MKQVVAQAPCYTNHPAIKLIPLAPDTVKVNTPFQIDAAAADATPCLDTNYATNMTITKLSGTGTVSGVMSVNAQKGMAHFNNIVINVTGTYIFKLHSGTLPDTSFKIIVSLTGGTGSLPCRNADPAVKVKFFNTPGTVNNSAPFALTILAMGNSNCIDTNYAGALTLSKAVGPGNYTGNTTLNFFKGMAKVNNAAFNQPGTYRLVAASGSLKKDTSMIINVMGGGGFNPCLSAAPAKKVKMGSFPNAVGVGANFNLVVYAIGDTSCIDTNYTGTINLSKYVGGGILSGTTSKNFSKGVVTFTNLSFNQPGAYRIIGASGSLKNDTTQNINVTSGGNSNPCPPTSTAGKRNNLGLYGGSSLDLTFSPSNNRLFAAISSPASLFYSDDMCATWKRAFHTDSLEYGCGKGWGGRAVKVLTNQTGWVGVQTSQEAGTLNALVVSYSKGDSGTWTTAMDSKMLNELGLGSENVSGMGLSDYYMYCLMTKYIIRIKNSTNINVTTDVINIRTAIAGMNQGARVKSIAIANNSTGYPFYCVIDTMGASGGMLYKYTGSAFSKLTLPAGMNGANDIYTHPGQVTGDTLFLSGMTGSGMKIYRSFNGGASWTDISYSGAGNWTLSDVDYSPAWKSTMTSSNGCVLIIPGAAMSTDMGASWKAVGLQNNGGAVHPADPNKVVGTKGRGVVVSTTGPNGVYTMPANYGLEAVTIKKIARTKSKGMFYLATRAGLAYTKAYSDTTIVGVNKWKAPYGEFPVANVGDDAGVFSVAIDPKDSLHVIAGYSNGFAVTKTGLTGFSNVMPSGWTNSSDPRANDIMFVNSSVVIAVSGGDNQSHVGKGNIWRSANGGTTWTKVSPAGFSNGNTVAMGTSKGDTVIYIGTGLYSGVQDNGVLWKSTDKGLTWTKVNDGPKSSTNPSVTKMPIYDISVDPRGKDTLYLASGSNLDHAFVRSKDGGLTYKTINAHGEGAFTSVAINHNHPDTVYTAIRRDILLYDAVNDTAKYIYRGLPGELVPDLAFGSVLAGTSMGFFKVKETVITNNTVAIHKENRVNMEAVIMYPNPVTDKLVLEFNLNHHSTVKIRIYDLTGREVKAVDKGILDEGLAHITVATDELAEGTYIVTLVTNNKVMSKRIVKMK